MGAAPIPSWQGFRDKAGGISTAAYTWLQSLASQAKATADAAPTEATAAEYQGNVAGFKALAPERVWAAADFVALTDGASIAVDMSSGWNFSVSIAGNRTLANPTNTKVGQSGCVAVTASGADRTIDVGTDYKKTTGITFPVTITSGTTAYLFYFQAASDVTLVTAVLNAPA